jgi:hypothetical protein
MKALTDPAKDPPDPLYPRSNYLNADRADETNKRGSAKKQNEDPFLSRKISGISS